MNERLSGYLGLANRAGRALVGEAIAKLWTKRKIYVLITANDAHSNTQTKLVQLAKQADITIIYMASKAELGQALGFNEVSSVAITDKGLAQQIIAISKEETT